MFIVLVNQPYIFVIRRATRLYKVATYPLKCVIFSWIVSQRINIYLNAKLIKSDNKYGYVQFRPPYPIFEILQGDDVRILPTESLFSTKFR